MSEQEQIKRNKNNYKGFTLISTPGDDMLEVFDCYQWKCDGCGGITAIDRTVQPHIMCESCKKSNSTLFDEFVEFIRPSPNPNESLLCTSIFGEHEDGTEYDFYVDFYAPALCLSFDFCEFNEKSILKHRNTQHIKALELRKAGIHHVTIYDHQWINRRRQVETFVMRAIDLIYHRSKHTDEYNSIKLLNKELAVKFINTNSISDPNANMYYGLYEWEDLVAVLPVTKLDETYTIYSIVWKNDAFYDDAFDKMLLHVLQYNFPQIMLYQMDVSNMLADIELMNMVRTTDHFGSTELVNIIPPKMYTVNTSPYEINEVQKGIKRELVKIHGYSHRLTAASMLIRSGKSVSMDSGALIYKLL